MLQCLHAHHNPCFVSLRCFLIICFLFLFGVWDGLRLVIVALPGLLFFLNTLIICVSLCFDHGVLITSFIVIFHR